MLDQVLITGGSGFFGKHCVKELLRRGATRVCIYSRGEYAQALMRAELHDDPRLRWFIGDVRDVERLRWAMDGIELVIHAAALKRIETCRYNVEEVIETNVLGARNVIRAARVARVPKIVALSTDKAWQPVSAYGRSKALAEDLFINANETRGTNGPMCACVRYGNVAGSTGSVIPTWRDILKICDTVPVTNPDATRFWMDISQAVDLVLDTAESMKGGELSIPQLPAYQLGDLAEAMGAKMDIRGMGGFEKLHEGMCDGNTSDIARRMSVDELRGKLAHV